LQYNKENDALIVMVVFQGNFLTFAQQNANDVFTKIAFLNQSVKIFHLFQSFLLDKHKILWFN